MKDGVRYEVNTTEELLRQVADSVEDVSYEQIQFEETLSDDTEVEIPDAQESEEESGAFHFRWFIITSNITANMKTRIFFCIAFSILQKWSKIAKMTPNDLLALK